MRYSRRFTWESKPNALSLARAEFEASGRRLLDLTISNPTRAGILYPPDLLAGLADPRILRYEPAAAGLREAREAVCEYYADGGVRVHPDQILLTASTSEAYQYLFKLLADPGDEVLVPRPSYPLFEFLAGMELLTTISYSATSSDPCNVASEKTRALVTVHPNNPTGDYLSEPAPSALAARCAALGIALIADEVFLDYGLGGAEPKTMAGLVEGNVFVLSGLSKICGLPQMKLGWMVLAGAPEAGVRSHLELIADTYLSVSAPVQWASIGWLRQRRLVQQPILDRIESNSRLLTDALMASGLTYRAPMAGWSAVIELPSTIDEEVLSLALLKEYGVLVQPGYFYDYLGGSRLVLSLLTPRADLELGLSSLKSLFSRFAN